MRRREFVASLAWAASWPLSTRAQQKAMPVIGYLNSTSPGLTTPLVDAFREGLRQTGYSEGQNLAIEYRWAEGDYDRLPALAAELVGRKVDLIVATAGIATARAAKGATTTIPIVFDTGGDPVALGLVASLARPGGNLTGVVIMNTELAAKRFELLCELVPQAKVIALMVNPNNPQTEGVVRGVQEAARTRGTQLQIVKAETEGEIDAVFATLVQLHAGGLLLGADSMFSSRREQLLVLASRFGIPTIFQYREFAMAGGLISYGTSLVTIYRQVGVYAGRVLKGEKPADLPVIQPTTFELVVNLKTAKVLGLTVPQSILARADQVIE